ncbi:hypothetical protein Slin14017_G092720 [Septoria linicola]|nr:hypothetical protein Slin14017_G092720 [Septoria linicola]
MSSRKAALDKVSVSRSLTHSNGTCDGDILATHTGLPAAHGAAGPQKGRASTISIASKYKDRAQSPQNWDTRTAPAGFKGAFQSAMYGSLTGSWLVQPVCSTGNCTWTEYTSLAVCSSCTNITSHLTREENPPVHATLMPHVYSANYKLENGMMIATTVDDQALLTQVAGASYYDNGFVTSTDWWIAYRPYQNMSIMGGVSMFWTAGKYSRYNITPAAYEEVTQYWPDPEAPMPESLRSQHAVKELYDLQRDLTGAEVSQNMRKYTNLGIDFESPAANGTIHTVDWLTLDGIRSWLNSMWSVSKNTYSADDIYDLTFNMYTTGRRDASNPGNLTLQQVQERMATMPGPEQLWSDVAQSLTTYIRTASSDVAEGVALSAETFVSARWAWAILPMSLLGLSLFFVIATVVVSMKRNMPLWKSNSLPPLYHGLTHATSEAIIGCSKSTDIMEKRGRLYDMSMLSGEGFFQMSARSGNTRGTSRWNEA